MRAMTTPRSAGIRYPPFWWELAPCPTGQTSPRFQITLVPQSGIEAIGEMTGVDVHRVQLGGTAIRIAGRGRVAIGKISIAHAVIDVGRRRIGGDVRAKSSDRILVARLIQQRITQVIEQFFGCRRSVFFLNAM